VGNYSYLNLYSNFNISSDLLKEKVILDHLKIVTPTDIIVASYMKQELDHQIFDTEGNPSLYNIEQANSTYLTMA